MKSVVPQLLHPSKTATSSHIKQLSLFTKLVIPKPPSGGVQSVHVPAGKAVFKQSSQPPTIATSTPIEAAANTASNPNPKPPLAIEAAANTASNPNSKPPLAIEAAANTASNSKPPLVVASIQPTTGPPDTATLQLSLESIAAVATVTNVNADSPPPKKLSVAERIKCLESNIQKKK
jgi:hypothetical protein